MKRLLCFLIGHDPAGPVTVAPRILYECRRCETLIRFRRGGGWKTA